MSLNPLDRRAANRADRKPVTYGLTPAALRVLDEHGPFCPHWIPGQPQPKPCLLRAGHSGRHDPRGGRSRNFH